MVHRLGRSSVGVSAMLAAVAVWLWPLGLGGRMPVGGDVTSFSLGLMAFLHDSLRAGRLPVWNDLWGYGFPGVGESQMGVYYPPHVLLYGLLPVETAYTASLVLHTAWAALGTFWAARRLGSSVTGAAIAGFTFAGCGFFLIHLPHQWGYTTGCWMPWAWGLAWGLAARERSGRDICLLAAVLTVQVLPGHFQLAFCTEVGVLAIAACALVEPRRATGRGVRGAIAIVAALAAVAPLGAAQLWPTLRLARLAATQRDYEYLSEFASTPVHLISYVAPRLFHASALWRPLAWDPFRTSPEEHLAYVGLVPLFLAVRALTASWRRDPVVRVLGVLALLTLILSLGPYVPGFALWCRLPGFSFFRASARWSLGTALALALLAGRGYDVLSTQPRNGRALARFAALAALTVMAAVGTVELAVRASEGRGWPLAVSIFDRAFRVWPWPDPPKVRDIGQAARAYHPNLLLSYAREEAGEGRTLDLFAATPRFVEQRQRIYARELREPALLLAALLVVSAFANRPRVFAGALLGLTLVDLWALGRHRPVDDAPIRPLTVQSPVLARLAELPRGTRAVTPAQNLPMIAGVGPLRAYRTLDLPALPTLTNLASAQPGGPEKRAALRVTGTGVSVHDDLGRRPVDQTVSTLTLTDPALASWLFGADLVASQGDRLSRFIVDRPLVNPARAWRLRLTATRGTRMLDTSERDVGAILRLFEPATPLLLQSPFPGRVDVEVNAEDGDVVVISQLADPQWHAYWVNGRQTREAKVHPAFQGRGQAGWQAVTVPEPGTWILRLEYDARDVRQGLTVSGVAWLALLGVVIRPGRRRPGPVFEEQET